MSEDAEKRTSPTCVGKETKQIALYIAFIPLLIAIVALLIILPNLIDASWWTSLDVTDLNGTWIPLILLAVSVIGIIWFILALMVRGRDTC